VQWMTSGRGIMHEEMPRRSPQGNVFGFQLWVNLPAARKMDAPRYQEVNAEAIPLAEMGEAHVRVVAGEVNGVRGPVTEIAARPVYMDVRLKPGAVFSQLVPRGHTAVAYVYQGKGTFGGSVEGKPEPVEAVHMVVFGDGDEIKAQAAPETSLHFMLMAGAPFKEPIVPYGPFVMNTMEEIQQALTDLRDGTFVQA
jgi:redox-sensitive bicupin YhaK (pirin superfamily)